MNLGLVRPEGHVSTAETRAGDLASVVWSAERGGYGYFSEDEGWVDARPGEVGIFALDVRKLAELLTESLDIRPTGSFVELLPGMLWDVGFGRLPGQMKRVSIWVARRLNDPDVLDKLRQIARDRPTLDLRLILGLSNAETSGWTLAKQVVVSVGSLVSVMQHFKIDASVASERLRRPSGKKESVLLSAEGGHLVVHGREYLFKGLRQRLIVQQLYKAWEDGDPRLLTQNVLTEAGCGLSVRRLANVFKDHPDWREVIKEEAGFCWLQA